MAFNEPSQGTSRRPSIRRQWHPVPHERAAQAHRGQEQLSGRPDVYSVPKEKDRVFENPFNADYLRCLKSGDPEIGNHFHSYFSARLRTKLRGRRLQDSDVHNMVQETFVRVLNAVANDEIHSPMAFGGYVSKVCDFVLCEFWNKTRSHEGQFYADVDEIEIIDPAPGVDSVLLRKERREQVAKILSDLRPKDRNLLRAKLFDELTPEEMCARFGSSANNLRLMLYRARKRFDKACEKQGVDFFGTKKQITLK